MIVIVAGSRHIRDMGVVRSAIVTFKYEITIGITGGCRGVDQMANICMITRSINTHVYDADWALQGRSAGPLRNQRMVDDADGLILVWDGCSIGSADILKRAKKANLYIEEHIIKGFTYETYNDKTIQDLCRRVDKLEGK